MFGENKFNVVVKHKERFENGKERHELGVEVDRRSEKIHERGE